jgi:outer membrane cobalamin receptor
MKPIYFSAVPWRAAILLLALAGPALAQSTTQLLPAVDVVASPIVGGTTLSAFGYQTTAVGAEQIAALNAPDLAAALRRTPGLAIARYNVVGSFGGTEGGAVFVRGLGSSRPGGDVKTTIDGVPTGNGVFNHPFLDVIPVDLAGGVEVSRRAAPLETGSGFAGINVATPRAAHEGGFARAAASEGSFGARSGKLEAGGRFGAAEVYAGQSYREADGHRPDSEGRLAHTMVRLGWRPLPALELSYLGHRSDNRAVDPGAEAGAGLPPTRGDVYLTESTLHTLGAAWTRAQGAGSLKTFVNQGAGDWLRRTTSANADSLNDYRATGVRWRETQQAWAGGEVLGGIDADWTRGSTWSVPPGAARALGFGPEAFRLVSAYAGARHTWRSAGGVEVTPSTGLRRYEHDQFGVAWAPQAGVVARKGAWQAHASAGRALNFPGLEVAAFSTVAIPALGQTWRTLRPERVTQAEAGVRYEVAPESAVELTVFRNEGRDRFVFVPPPPPPFRFVNVESFRTQGAELTVTTRPTKRVSLFAGVSGLDATPGDLPYAPRWSLTGGAAWRVTEGLMLHVDGSYVGAQRVGAQARSAGTVNTERVGALALVNARLGHGFAWGAGALRGEFFFAVENALDRSFRYRPGYPMPGTGFTLGVSAGL